MNRLEGRGPIKPNRMVGFGKTESNPPFFGRTKHTKKANRFDLTPEKEIISFFLGTKKGIGKVNIQF